MNAKECIVQGMWDGHWTYVGNKTQKLKKDKLRMSQCDSRAFPLPIIG